VVTSLGVYGDVAREVAGPHGQVTTLINSTAVDPHDFQPSTSQAETVSRANVVVVNGLGYDYWLNKLVASNNRQLAMINVARQVANKHAGDNEHVWYLPSTLPRLADRLAQQYSKIDPDHADDYHTNARRFKKQLTPLQQTIATAKKNAQRSANKRVAVTEPVFDYALDYLGYSISDPHFAKAVEDGSDPSPADVRYLQDDLVNHRVAFLVENTQSSGKTIKNLVQLANKENVPVLKVTETKPKNISDVNWLLNEYQQLIRIQEKEGSSSH
jgi:zinc/manganese transport system substrate-binding protein